MFDENTPLVSVLSGEARSSTLVIAKGVAVQHKNVMALLRRHMTDFESFGKVAFETRLNQQGSSTQYAMLNEHQAGLLIAFMRNSPRVIKFKVALIREFFRMRDALNLRDQSLYQQLQALIAEEVSTQVRASFGSRLMLERKRAIPGFRERRERIEAELQPSLILQ